jgi:tripartite-type tricarboxylate transporter receptor subunit TctC
MVATTARLQVPSMFDLFDRQLGERDLTVSAAGGGVARLCFAALCSFAQIAAVMPAFPLDGRYPDHAVKIIVPFAPGGVVDVMARELGQRLTESLGQQFYIENLGGAGGNIGTRVAAASSADGYTMLITSSSFVVNPSMSTSASYDPERDFAAVTIAATSPNVLVVYPGEHAKTARELVEAIRNAPGTYSFASAGVGTTPHLAGELFRSSTGTDLVHVPFAGSGPAMQATVAGHTRMAFVGLPPAMTLIKAGSLRALAITAAKRSPALPDVPTMAEAGFNGQESETLLFVLVPAHTPPDIVTLLNREVVKILDRADVRQAFDALGFTVIGDAPQQASVRTGEEIEKWSKVIHAANLNR